MWSCVMLVLLESATDPSGHVASALQHDSVRDEPCISPVPVPRTPAIVPSLGDCTEVRLQSVVIPNVDPVVADQ